MGGRDNCRAIFLQFVEEIQQHRPIFSVEAVERLVEKHELRTCDDGTRQQNALLLTTGEVAETFTGAVGKPDFG